MNTSDSPYLEELYPEIIENIYTPEGIDDMIETMESLNLSEQSEAFVNFCISIKEAVDTYEKNSGNKYIFSKNILRSKLEEKDLVRQMQEFNSEKNNVVSIEDGSEYNLKTTNETSGFKVKVRKILSNFR